MSLLNLARPRNGSPGSVSVLAPKLMQMSTPETPQEKYGYNHDLNKYRNHIDNINTDHWKKVRWYINEYDFLVKDPVINRAFYKYWEIINEFDIFEKYEDKNLILHCAEAPGGFIQGTNIYLQMDRMADCAPQSSKKETIVDDDGFTKVQKRKRPKNDHRIFTISLNKDLPQYKTYNLPSYNKNIVHSRVCITYGKDNTGDINRWENLHYIKQLANGDFYLITADGGFDEGTDFNNKEQLHYYLILSEIYAAVQMQKRGGHFILKVFDIYTETSLHLMYFLSLCYDEMYVYKPKTSRPTNSEKYIICKGFALDENTRKIFASALQEVYRNIQWSNAKYISFSVFSTLPSSFVDDICTINRALVDKQCEHLKKAVELCQNSEFIDMYEQNLEACVERRKEVFHRWEQMYNLGAFV